jgi:hypothetical protein
MKFGSYIIALIIYLIGYVLHSPIVVSFSTIVFSMLYCLKSFKLKKIQSVDVIFMFLIASGLAATGNIFAILSRGAENEAVYFLYIIPEFIYTATVIHFFGTLFITLGYQLANNSMLLPKISVVKVSWSKIPVVVSLALLSILLATYNLLPSLGSLSYYVKLIPVFIIFFLARLGASHKSTKIKNYSLVIVILETIRALFFEYLRMNIALPVIAYFLGLVIGERKIKSLFTLRFYLIYAFAILSISYFTVFGQLRSSYLTGLERISLLNETESSESNSLWSRMSNLNQITNVVDLTVDNGFYDGQTLSYFIYALIPRFLWPEKPIIAKGRWFALEIGQAYEREEGHVNNSINMTVPGEFYLNYSWVGLILGSLLFGYFIALLWCTTKFWEADNNLFGNIFGFYLLFMGLFSLGADMQVVITLIAIYLISLILSKIFKAFG